MPPAFPSGFTIEDAVFAPLFIAAILFFAVAIKSNNIERFPYYRYFIPGLLVKFLGAFGLCYIYLYYYKEGGDTLNYFHSARILNQLIFLNPAAYFKILLGDMSAEVMSNFNNSTNYPFYTTDPLSFFVVRVISPFVFISFGSYLASSFLITFITYSGVWKFYTVMVEAFPSLAKQLAVAALFIPSVFFWGSGILKDPITFSALGWYTYAFYYFFFDRKKKMQRLGILIISIYVILSIKPYIFYALLPASGMSLAAHYINTIKGRFIKSVATPFLMILFMSGTLLALTQIGKDKGKYSIDQIMEYGVVVQQDLKREAYGGNYFDIGSFDATLPSMLSKAPLAINATLFRPYLWEARNPVMLFSALENTVILLIVLRLLIRLKIINLFLLINQNYLLVFSMSFALIFAFFVGLTTSNFGSLVRYKIPALPFFATSIVLLNYYYRLQKNGNKKT